MKLLREWLHLWMYRKCCRKTSLGGWRVGRLIGMTWPPFRQPHHLQVTISGSMCSYPGRELSWCWIPNRMPFPNDISSLFGPWVYVGGQNRQGLGNQLVQAHHCPDGKQTPPEKALVQGHTMRGIKMRLPVSCPLPRALFLIVRSLPFRARLSCQEALPGKGSFGLSISSLHAFKSHQGTETAGTWAFNICKNINWINLVSEKQLSFCIYYKVMRQRRGCPTGMAKLGEKLIPRDCEHDPRGLTCYGQTMLEGPNPAPPASLQTVLWLAWQ